MSLRVGFWAIWGWGCGQPLSSGDEGYCGEHVDSAGFNLHKTVTRNWTAQEITQFSQSTTSSNHSGNVSAFFYGRKLQNNCKRPALAKALNGLVNLSRTSTSDLRWTFLTRRTMLTVGFTYMDFSNAWAMSFPLQFSRDFLCHSSILLSDSNMTHCRVWRELKERQNCAIIAQ